MDLFQHLAGILFYVDTDTQAVKFEFETKDGKNSGPIVKFIERMEDV
jgi:hypothetical protein